MMLTDAEREECYALLGADETRCEGHIFTPDRKRWAAEHVIAAATEFRLESPVKPSTWAVRGRVRKNLMRNREANRECFEDDGTCGSVILLAIFVALIGWVTRKLLDWLWERWN